jgi:UDP-N-acetylmuramoyl-L-alanyl-D-glutamate--2,6-diaminopimelate ligase
MNLATLLDGIATPERDAALDDITLDSRDVRQGSVFLACRGARHHGLDFASDVAARGAAAILWEPEADRAPPTLRSDIVVTRVPSLSERASEIAGRFFGVPSRQLAIAGITGTNGKTTTAWLLAQALNACGRPAAYLGTLGSAFGGALKAGEFTTPDAVNVQRRLAAFRAQGAACVAMEVSSHALAQSRVAAVRFDAAVFTNLTRDHLDYHGSMGEYAAAKARLFAFEGLRRRVINADDAFGAELLSRPGFERAIATSRRAGYAPRQGQNFLQALDVMSAAQGMRFQLRSSFGTAQVTAPLVGSFNVDNLLAVLGVLLGGGVAFDAAVCAVATVTAPPGRLETFGGGALPLAVVDYAHTPDALDKALAVLREHCSGRLWCVFGCGGDRDAGKRPDMGRIATAHADRVIVTDDNPRSEDPAAIVRGILAGVAGAAPRVIHDRGAAIATAIAEAAPGDAVLVAGKGHEDYQLVGRERRAFSDARAVRAALARRSAA